MHYTTLQLHLRKAITSKDLDGLGNPNYNYLFCAMAYTQTDVDTYQHEPQEWTLTLLQGMTFLNACNRIMILLERPEINGLAFRVLHRGMITLDEVGDMIDKLCEGMGGEPIEMYDEDILVLYTIMELYIRLMLTDAGDEIREGQIEFQAKMPESKRFDMDAIFKMELKGISAFVREIIEEYADHPDFIARKELLQELNDYI